MNKIWSVCIVICIGYGLLSHQENTLFALLFEVPNDALNMALKLTLNACFFNGILNMANGCGLLEKVSHLIQPILKHLFKGVNQETMGYISVHLLSNLFGLGSVATISGLKAMRLLKEATPDRLSKAMMTLFILNTTGLSFFPSTVVALRQTYDTTHSADFIPYTIMISLLALSIGLLIINYKYRE